LNSYGGDVSPGAEESGSEESSLLVVVNLLTVRNAVQEGADVAKPSE
jgi:hypothetical protein